MHRNSDHSSLPNSCNCVLSAIGCQLIHRIGYILQPLRCLNYLVEPTSGEVIIDGQRVGGLSST